MRCERNLVVVGAFCILGLMATPAFGWWEVVEHLSGPGPFKGFDIDTRLICFVDRNADKQRKREAISRRTEATRESAASNWARAATTWRETAAAWERLAGSQAYRALDARRDAEDFEARFAKKSVTQEEVAHAWERASRAMESVATDGDVRAFAAPGLLYSACNLKPGERRKGAIDFGFRFLRSAPSDRFAPNERIAFTTMEPAISWNIISNPNADFIDYGFGAGFYWISSQAFPSVTGGFLEPVRLDIHAPTNWPWWSRVPILRLGLLNFPGGFEPDAFAPSGAEERISRDWSKAIGIYGDLEPILKWLNGEGR
jgi:hypothetical protein